LGSLFFPVAAAQLIFVEIVGACPPRPFILPYHLVVNPNLVWTSPEQFKHLPEGRALMYGSQLKRTSHPQFPPHLVCFPSQHRHSPPRNLLFPHFLTTREGKPFLYRDWSALAPSRFFPPQKSPTLIISEKSCLSLFPSLARSDVGGRVFAFFCAGTCHPYLLFPPCFLPFFFFVNVCP